MQFAKFYRNLTACLVMLWLVGCTSTTQKSEFQRSQAVEARLKLALAYLEQNDFPKAKQNIDKALSHDQQDYLPHSVLAYYYQQIGENSLAEETYQAAIKMSQTQSQDQSPSPDVLNNYGTFLCRQGKFELAYPQFEQALKSQAPYYHQADTLENQVLCAHQQSNISKAKATLTLLEKLEPKRSQQLKALLKL